MNKRTAYFECNTGISGDMTVAALLDLGADQEVLNQVLSSLPVSGFQTRISRVKKAGLDVCDFDVLLDEIHENHDHDMNYLHGHDAEQSHKHTHKHAHTHEHRGLQEVLQILEEAKMTSTARALAVRIFDILARAEAKAHGVPVAEVHFHEVGAVDSIVDIVAAAVCLDSLGIEQVIIPVICEGTGTVRCQHGILPVPVPAVLNIVEQNGLNIAITDIQGELVTPTGAAIAAAIKSGDQLPPSFQVLSTGMGAGKRTYSQPSILRVMLIKETV